MIFTELLSYRHTRKGAPLIRNKEMVDIADMVIVIWDGKSRGTKNTIDYATSRGKKVVLITDVK